MQTITDGWKLLGDISTDKDSFEVDPQVLDCHPFLDYVGGSCEFPHPVLDRLTIRNVVPGSRQNEFEPPPSA